MHNEIRSAHSSETAVLCCCGTSCGSSSFHGKCAETSDSYGSGTGFYRRKIMTDNYRETADRLISFLEKSPSCYHAAANIRERLLDEEYTELYETDSWELRTGGKYFVMRNHSSVISFRIPESAAGETGFLITASHTDSPALKIKENPEMPVGDHYVKLNVEKYGGMLMAPWFDRPLSAAGRVVVRQRGENGEVRLEERLVQIDRDLLMIPSLAIHMDREANAGHAYNVQNDLCPLFGDRQAEGHFLKLLAESAGVLEEDLLSYDLFVYNRERASVWGASEEFLSAPRIDDLACCFGTLEGFLRAEDRRMIPVHAAFDNEEVGSGTKQGADSTFLYETLERIAEGRFALPAALAGSFMISADNGHAMHPNYQDKADPVNRPRMNGGIVIKETASQKYTTDAVSKALCAEIAGRAGIPVQYYTNRSDIPGGSTLGNISESHVSVDTVDIGLAQLAMHSPYETMGVRDESYMTAFAKAFYETDLQRVRGMWVLGK